MKTIAAEQPTVQFPLVEHSREIGWSVVSENEALSKRKGEGGLFFYAELQGALTQLKPGLITENNLNSVIQKLESIPNTIEGNRENLEWLRGNRTVYDEAERRYTTT